MSAAEPLAGAAVAGGARSRCSGGMPLSIRFALGFLLLMVVVSLLAPVIAPYDFATQNLARRLRPPVFWGGEWAYVLGTDHLGRDILSRLIYGIRTSIAIALAGTLIGAAIGTVLGYVAARRRGWLDDVIMMMVDVQAALPAFFIAIAFIALVGSNLLIFVVLVSLEGWERYTRLVRGLVISEQAALYVRAVKALGATAHRVNLRHVPADLRPPQEPLDPVRYLSNRSSGKQGFALAQAALDLGARVSLVVGATAAALSTPTGAERTDVETAAQMAEAVLELSRVADVLIMAAAVADFRPRQVQAHKIKKGALPRIELEHTQDILLAVAEQRRRVGRPAVVVGFAAESEDLLKNAQEKLERKRLSMIVANDISAPDAGFAVDTNRVTLLLPGGVVEPLPLMRKQEVAEVVLARVVGLLQAEAARGGFPLPSG